MVCRSPVTVLFCLGLTQLGFAVEWSLADFDWNSLRLNDTVPSGLWIYKHEAPEKTDPSVLSASHPTAVDSAGMEQITVMAA